MWVVDAGVSRTCTEVCLSLLLHLRFSTDSLHVSRPPQHLMTVDGQLAAFAEQLMPYSRDAAAACLAAQSGSLTGAPLHT
jgi:hypothetical protein